MSNLVIFETNGEQVAFDPRDQMWSLTAMHAASGMAAHKAPAEWLRQKQTQEYIGALVARLNMGVAQSNMGVAHIYNEAGDSDEPKITADSVVQTRRGGFGGGTWAHWQIAAAYAHYLSADFYLQWNEWALERATRPAAPPSPVPSPIAQLAALEARLTALEARSGAGRIVVRRTVEEIEIDGIPPRPWSAAIRAVLARADGPMSPADVAGVLMRAGIGITRTTQVSVQMWDLARRGKLRRVEYGLYTIAS
jgi:hypothetical protein